MYRFSCPSRPNVLRIDDGVELAGIMCDVLDRVRTIFIQRSMETCWTQNRQHTTTVTNGTFAKSFGRDFHLFSFVAKTVGNVRKRVHRRRVCCAISFCFVLACLEPTTMQIWRMREFVGKNTYFWRRINRKMDFCFGSRALRFATDVDANAKIDIYFVFTVRTCCTASAVRRSCSFRLPCTLPRSDRHSRLIYFVKQLNRTRLRHKCSRAIHTHRENEWMSGWVSKSVRFLF